ncbi:MAG: MarR family transcriptional regulator [Oscillochloris sp.]|nr:MarR family transcriptional regulator [Oscillochloris sp.]
MECHHHSNAHRLLHLMDQMRHRQRSPVMGQIADLNLSFSHMRVLRLLAPANELAMKDLAEQLQLTPPSLTALTRRLVQSGMVERRPHHEDSRIVLLRLSEAGRDLHRRLYEEHVQRMQDLLAALSDEEQELFLDLLDRAVRALDDYEPVTG